MRPKSITVTSSNTPYYVPLDWRSGDVSIVSTPAGSGNYSVDFTLDDAGAGLGTGNTWMDVDDGTTVMTTATTQLQTTLHGVTGIRVILHSGASVKINLSQPDV